MLFYLQVIYIITFSNEITWKSPWTENWKHKKKKKTTLIIIFLASCRIKLFKFKVILPILKYLERGENPPLLFINNFTTNYAL